MEMEASTSQIDQNTIDTKVEAISSVEQVKNIYEAIKDNPKVNVYGPPGVGKTRVAKRVSGRLIKEGVCDVTLWMFMCKNNTKDSLSVSFARQLCLLPSTQEWEEEDDQNDGDRKPETKPETWVQDRINKKITDKKVLLILDDFVDDNTDNKSVVWKEILSCKEIKTIIVSRSRIKEEGIFNENAFEVKPLTRSEAVSLLSEKLDVGFERIRALGEKLIERSGSLAPRSITIIAKALNYFGADASGVSISKLEKELEDEEEAGSGNYNVNKLLCQMHEVFPIGVLKDLWRRGHHFFRDSGSVDYNELITYWILERFLGDGTMTELYRKGHDVLMELIDCGVLKPQEDGFIFMDRSVIDVDDLYQCVDQIPSLGLATVFSDGDGFGQIGHENGMIKTPRKDGQDLSVLLLDGTHFSEQVMTGFLDSKKKLRFLGLFNPTIKSLPNELKSMEDLRVLVLRGCEFLHDVRLPLHGLQALEISGARSLKLIRSEFFKDMIKLQSLHLSGLQITKLPQVVYDSLVELRWLVVKDCRRLKKIESLTRLVNLMVIDFSGNVSLEAVDKNFLKFTSLQSLNLSNTKVPTTPLLKNIGSITHLLCRDCENLGRLRGLTMLTSLETIDISGSTDFEEFHDSSLESLHSLRTLKLSSTKLDRLPSNISNPRVLHLKKCLELQRLSCIQSIVDLQELDVSGSKNLKEIEDDFFDNMTRLRVLNLSETDIVHLPSFSNLSNLRELFINRCSSLLDLPSLESCKNLEILDASDCSSLEDIEDESFEDMTRLRKLNFSRTKIKSFPLLSNPSSLQELLLSNCTSLQNLKLNVQFPNLEEMNLSGIAFLDPKTGTDFVQDSINLRVLDLSHTSLEHLPSMSKLENLTHLSLSGCASLETELDLGSFHKLRVLDLSRSSVKCLQNLNNCKNLQKLLLEACQELKGFPNVDVNDLLHPNSETTKAISLVSSQLEYVVFPGIDDVKEDLNRDEWNVCRISEDNKPPMFLSGTQFLKLLMKNDNLSQEPLHLCAIPVIKDNYINRHELVFQDVYLQNHRFSQYKLNRSLQIRGFETLPNNIETIIRHNNLLFLIDNEFESLPIQFDPSIVKKLKGLWIERCDKLVTIFEGNFEAPLQDLGISNNRLLKTIYKGKQDLESFNSLKSLYLDRCPDLLTVFPSTWLPKNLEILHIKYCDKLKSVFETGSGELPNLQTLNLWELPELENIRFSSFPSLQTLKIWECPEIREIENFKISSCLKTLWIAGSNTLKSLNAEFGNMSLETLKLVSCPMLKYVMPSEEPLIWNIKMIEIRSCEKLRALFRQRSGYQTFQCLNMLLLEDLPALEKIGAILPPAIKICAYECPVLIPEERTYDYD